MAANFFAFSRAETLLADLRKLQKSQEEAAAASQAIGSVPQNLATPTPPPTSEPVVPPAPAPFPR